MSELPVSERILLENIASTAFGLKSAQKGLSIGRLLRMIRKQLGISQTLLAKKAGVPQSTLSRIELGKHYPSSETLEPILSVIDCSFVISIFPNNGLERIRYQQAAKKAEKNIRYVKGTMSLEKQRPDDRFLRELMKDEIKRLLNGSGYELWSGD